MTKKQRAEAVTQFLSNRLKEAANDFHKKKDYGDEDKKSEDLAKVIVIRDLLKELNDGQTN